MSPLRHVTVSPATTVSFAGLNGGREHVDLRLFGVRGGRQRERDRERSRPALRTHHLTLILPSIHGCTAQTKFSVLPLAAVTLKVTLPFGGR